MTDIEKWVQDLVSGSQVHNKLRTEISVTIGAIFNSIDVHAGLMQSHEYLQSASGLKFSCAKGYWSVRKEGALKHTFPHDKYVPGVTFHRHEDPRSSLLWYNPTSTKGVVIGGQSVPLVRKALPALVAGMLELIPNMREGFSYLTDLAPQAA